MFSPLARGSANWDGGIQLGQAEEDLLSENDYLPQISLKNGQAVKSSKSFDASYDDGRLPLPKTFVTRNGALLLFTPSKELITTEKETTRATDVYEDGLTLRTIGNLASSVLQFGKEEEQAWEGIPSTPPPPPSHKQRRSSHDNQQPIKDRKAFLRFLHYLDSESLTADKHAQPGCDPGFYLDELRSSSRVVSSQRRSRDVQTPYSNRTYSSFLEDDDVSDIVREYVKWNKLDKQLQQENTETENDQDIQDNPDIDEYMYSSTSPGQPKYTKRSHSLSPQYFNVYDESLIRPSTAPLPPAPETPRANPRITSGKRPPPTRALGTKPGHLELILRADINPGRNARRGPSPRLKFSRNTSATFYSPSSRGGSPEHGMMPRYETPGAMSENWSRADDIIQEVDEIVGLITPTRPVSAASYISSHSLHKTSKQSTIRRASTGGTSSKDVDDKMSASRSVSMSSVSHQKSARSVSSKSRAHSHSQSRGSVDFHDDIDLEVDKMTSFSKDDSCVLCAPPPGVRKSPRSMSAPQETRTYGYPTSSANVTMSRDSVTSPSRDVTQSRLSHASDASSKRLTSNQDLQPSDVVPRAMSRASNVSRMSSSSNNGHSESPWQQEGQSRVSGRTSRTASKMSAASYVIQDFEGHGMALRSRSALTRRPNRSSRGGGESNQSRPISAPVSIPGDGTDATLATLGSEANIADVIEVMPRTQVVYIDDGSDEERGLDSADEAWPVNADGELEMSGEEQSEYGSEAEEVNLDLPSSPTLTSSGFFQLDSSWSPAPPIEKAEDPANEDLTPQPPSETGATGFQSRSPSPTPNIRTPALIVATETDTDSITSQVDEGQWPPQAPQECSPTPPPVDDGQWPPQGPHECSPTPPLASPLPTVTINKNQDDNETFRPATPHIYQETIDIQQSRPSSPTTSLERQQPVSVSESVVKYLETAHEPAERPRSGRARKTPDLVELDPLESTEKHVEDVPPPVVVAEVAKFESESTKESVEVVPDRNDKPKSAAGKDKLVIGADVTKDTPKQQRKSTLEETEARRDYVSSLLIKSNPSVQRGKLELEGIGKEGEEAVSISSHVSVVPTAPIVYESSPKKPEPQHVKPAEPPKNDLSDLAALINRNKSAKSTKEKKEVKKKPKTPKSSKKEIKVDPQNIDFEAFNTPEMLAHMDDELKELIRQQNPNDTLEGTTATSEVISNSQHVDVPQVATKVPPEKKNAYTPSKPKKPSKQELAKKRAEARKADKKKKEEDKKRREEERVKREEELRLLKEREREQEQARKEAELKQQAIEEERAKRLAEEEEARREEEEAMEKLKEAKKKAREEREQRRAAEAERRKLEVQRKREEKKRKEEEMREKEKEMEQMKVDQEKRKQELLEAKRRQEELDRLEEERRQEEERLRLLEEEEEQRRLEEEQIREAEEELRRLQEEREYKEQMRRIAEARERKLREEEEERLRQEEEERRKLEEERRRIQQQEEEKVEQEKRRIDIARRLEAVARMRLAHEATRRKTMLLRRREENLSRMQHLRSVRQEQGLTRGRVFSYYVRIPRQVWEVPIGFNKQKKGFRAVKKKPPPKT